MSEPKPMFRARPVRPILLSVLLAIAGSSCLNGRVFSELAPLPIPAMRPAEGLDSLSASSCGSCHGAVYEEWLASALSGSWSDEAFAAQYAHQDQRYDCASCHAPLENQVERIPTGLSQVRPELVARTRRNGDFDPQLQSEGVTCVVCHQHGGVLHGPAEQAEAPHGVVHNPVMAEGANSCAHCHQTREDPLGQLMRPRYDTVVEWLAWRAVSDRDASCADCHMPIAVRIGEEGKVTTGRTHSFPGASDDETVRAGLTVREPIAVTRGVSVTLANKAGHRYPSGSTARALEVSAIVIDDDGRELARKTEWLERRLAPDGRELSDSTLLPGEIRELRFRFAPDEMARAAVVRVSAVFHRYRGMPAAARALAETQPERLTVQVETRDLKWPPDTVLP